MQKIFEIKSEDWTKGISAQRNKPVGGLFQQLQGIDPFYNEGLCVPSFTPSTITPSSTPKFITNFLSSGVAYTYWHSDTEIKQVLRDSPYTQTDQTAQLTFGGLSVIGAILWNGYYVYARANGDLRARAIPISGGTDTQIKNGFGSVMHSMPLCIGKPLAGSTIGGYLYHGDSGRVGIITSGTSTVGNGNVFLIDKGFFVRDLINDGQNLVIIADNNSDDASGSTASRQAGNYKCRVYFWDYIKATADVIYDVDDSYLIAGQQLDGNIYFFGYNGLYICNSANPPRMIRPFIGYNGLSTAKPKNSYQLVKHKGSIYWLDGFNSALTNGVINAYGNPTAGGTKIFYQPHLNSNSSNLQTVLQVVGDQFWFGTAEPKIYVHNIGSTSGVGTISFFKIMSQPHRYEFTKVVLSTPLSSGQTVSVLAVSASGNSTISNTETKSYSATNPRQVLIFKRTPTTNSQEKFEDLRVTVIATGASIQRIATYATPLPDSDENL